MTDLLTGLLVESRQLGFLGPGPVESHHHHALAFAAAVDEPPARALDLGAGGGLPGLVLAAAIWPDTIWTFLDRYDIGAVRETAAEVEELGFDALWFGEYAGRDAFTQAAFVLAATSTLTVATGVARFDLRTPVAAEMASRALAEAYPGRFVLGLGGHRPGARPVDAMREYLDGMDKAELVLASPRPRRVLAALGPKMLDLAAERTDGAHPYFVPPEHTGASRRGRPHRG